VRLLGPELPALEGSNGSGNADASDAGSVEPELESIPADISASAGDERRSSTGIEFGATVLSVDSVACIGSPI
jgi:hypothetical protein